MVPPHRHTHTDTDTHSVCQLINALQTRAKHQSRISNEWLSSELEGQCHFFIFLRTTTLLTPNPLAHCRACFAYSLGSMTYIYIHFSVIPLEIDSKGYFIYVYCIFITFF